MQEICSSCNKRKPNRFCPGLNTAICSQCCGRSRHKQIQCPDGCHFLMESRRLALQRLVKLSGDGEFEITWFEVLHNLRLTLIRVGQKTATKLTNDEASAALANLIASRRVRSKGLIYELRSPNPNIQEVADSLRTMVERYEKEGAGQNGRYAPSELDECLRYLHRQAKTAEQKGVDFLGLLSLTVGNRLIGLNESTKPEQVKVNGGIVPSGRVRAKLIDY